MIVALKKAPLTSADTVAKCLCAFGNKALISIDHILAKVADGSPQKKSWFPARAGINLAKFGLKAIPALLSALVHRDPRLRKTGENGLATLGKVAFPFLKQGLKSNNPKEQIGSLRAISHMEPRVAAMLLKEALLSLELLVARKLSTKQRKPYYKPFSSAFARMKVIARDAVVKQFKSLNPIKQKIGGLVLVRWRYYPKVLSPIASEFVPLLSKKGNQAQKKVVLSILMNAEQPLPQAVAPLKASLKQALSQKSKDYQTTSSLGLALAVVGGKDNESAQLLGKGLLAFLKQKESASNAKKLLSCLKDA